MIKLMATKRFLFKGLLPLKSKTYYKINLSNFSNYNLSKHKKNLREIEKIKTIEKQLIDKKVEMEEHEDYVQHKDKYNIISFLIKIGLFSLVSGTSYLIYGLFVYPVFSKESTDFLIRIGGVFNSLNMMFAGSYLGFHIKSPESAMFLKSSLNLKTIGLPLLFTFLGVSNFFLLDILDYKHLISFFGINLGLLTFEFLNKKRLKIPSWYINFRFMFIMISQIIYIFFFFQTTYPNRKLQELESSFRKSQTLGKSDKSILLGNTIESLKNNI